MSSYSISQIQEPIEFDHDWGSPLTRRETMTKDFWYFHTCFKYLDVIIPILSPKATWNDEYMQIDFKHPWRMHRLKTFSVYPYSYKMLRRMLKIK